MSNIIQLQGRNTR